MNKISLSILLIITALCFQNCKKSSTTADDTTVTATPLLEATINNVVWEPDTLAAAITYNSATKTKVFSFTGTSGQKRLDCTVTLQNSTNTNAFTIGAYNIDATPNPLITYSIQEKDNTGAYVFVPIATAGSGDGAVTISNVDAVNNQITGSYYFSTRKVNYDSNGNIVSIVSTIVTGGAFTAMPYTYTAK